MHDLLEGHATGDSREELSDRLEKVPKDLQDIYARIFDRLRPEHQHEASLMLSLVCHAMRPLSMEELLAAVSTSTGTVSLRADSPNPSIIKRRI